MKVRNYLGRLTWKLIAKSISWSIIFLPVIAFYCYLAGQEATSLVLLVIAAVFLAWMTTAYCLRFYSRAVVYSYTLEHNIYLPRLEEQNYMPNEETGWYNVSGGYIQKLKVSKLKYNLTYWLLWGFVDDDCDRDTVPIGYGRDILAKEHFSWAPEFFRKLVKREQDILEAGPHGNSFTLGNNLKPSWTPILSILWMFRNLAYNFNYSLEEMREDDPLFFYYRTKWRFPSLIKDKVADEIIFALTPWHFGYIPYTNKDRKGRMVFFSEDIDKMTI